ncbi:uncharacterized protein LOC110739845 [Chenopodium quinoa]|uniref:SAM domain-containing protein n=1 Tax=Chenopodium quinoa TaxID=63459 RepID=A0A803N0C7_CHEQI|nr:uncharacterized protein LOC110739845 [Chenopodium quinoa]XP_021776021.1 uncharacterized protein LOC110739845 [Chenopodium quinoa]
MLGSKWKHLGELKNNAMENTSNITVDSDLCGEDGWTIVKKQRVNILIPRLPSTEQSSVPDLEQGQLRGSLSCNMTNNPSELPLEKPLKANFIEGNDGSLSLSSKSNTQSSAKVHSPVDNAVAILNSRKPVLRRLALEDQVGASRSFSGKTENHLKFRKTSPKLVRTFMQPELSVICTPSITIKYFNKKTRASNLERNIISAGGLGKWLSSLGLEQFEGILRAKNVNKFQLVDLSMKKLKDMGAHAVGPRRKLIHAIECVCHPYSFEPFKKFQSQLR